MGEIIYRELMMTKFIEPGLWTYTMDRSKTEGQNINTFYKKTNHFKSSKLQTDSTLY